jgi:hypothetical protein
VSSLTAYLVLVRPASMRRVLADAMTSFDRNGEEEEEEEEEESLMHLTSTLLTAKPAHLLGRVPAVALKTRGVVSFHLNPITPYLNQVPACLLAAGTGVGAEGGRG